MTDLPSLGSYFKKKIKRKKEEKKVKDMSWWLGGPAKSSKEDTGKICNAFNNDSFSQEYYEVICCVHLLVLFLFLSLRFLTQKAITPHHVRSYHVTLNVDLG